jgi:Cft2 family RNA processing exonuclease
VTECTFGRSRYAFPPIEETRKRIVGFCNRVLIEGETPVLLAYSLGKSQELMAILSREGISPVIHESIAAMSAVYAKHGVDLGSHMVWNGRNHGGRVMIIPPNARRRLAALGNIRSAVLSGWALNADAVYRYGCDEAFPLSDHADHGELIEHVEEVCARRVYTVHGFTEEFAGDLRYLGMDALALGGGNQLELLR